AWIWLGDEAARAASVFERPGWQPGVLQRGRRTRAVDCPVDYSARHDLVAWHQRLRQARRRGQRRGDDAGFPSAGIPVDWILHHEGCMSTSNATPVMLPSRAGLLMRLGGALVVAAIILVGFVLPAEYQITPTG